MSERAQEIKVGLLVVVALGVLAAFVVVLGNFSLSEGFTFKVNFTFTGNLQSGAPVKVAGIKVGKVEQVAYLGGQKDKKSGKRVYVQLTAWVEQRVEGTIFKDAEFFINTQGVLGEQYLEIVPGSEAAGPIGPGETYLGVSPPRMDLVVARLFEVLDGVTRLLRDDKETIRDLLKNGASALSTVDTLLAENRENLKKLIADLDRFVDQAGKLLSEVRGGMGDPKRLGRILAAAERTVLSVSRRIDALIGQADRTLAGLERLTSVVGPQEEARIKDSLKRLSALAAELQTVSGQAGKLVAALGRGEGTAGALLVNDELYRDLREMVRDLKRHPWKFLWRE